MEKRTRLAWASIVCFIALVLTVISTGFENIAGNPALGFIFKLTVAVSVLWLAWPDLVKLNKRLPPRFIIAASIALIFLIVQPRIGALLFAGLITYWGLWWGYQQLFTAPSNGKTSTHRPKSNKPNHS